ncbi:cytochrome P450 [Actinomycetospora aeridis]|uniref:Cytochrome P450 n=1 Tax=Actinomycetospora aeridis TaxID=3129231 RepID=A0ABU8MZA8_9PSEU
MSTDAGTCPYAHDYPFGEAEALEFDPAYARLRAEEPLARIRMPYGEEGWLATRYTDVKTVLSDPRFSRAAVVGADVPRAIPEKIDRPDTITNIDPPEHGRVRRLVASAFTARRAEALRPRVREVADGLVDDMLAAGSPANLVEAVAMPLPVIVICELLGVPLADRDVFRAGADAMLSTSKVPTEKRQAAMADLQRYIGTLVADRRSRPEGPGDDVLGALVSAREEDGDRLSEAELVSLGVAILVAGHETTMNMTSDMVLTLLSERARWEALVADPEQVPAAVEEMLRITPLGRHAGLPRIATEDVELSGGTVHAGEAVLVSTIAANRDPEVFDDPEELHLDRGSSSHVAFGFGPHHCLGASLARMELQTALTTLVTRVPTLDLAGEVTWRETALVRGPAEMPVRW